MKAFNLCIIGLVVITLGTLPTNSASAQPEMTVEPNTLTVAATHCWFQRCTAQRTLLIRASALTTNLEVKPGDLARADGVSLPATVVRPSLTANQLQPSQLLSVPVEFDLNSVSSGEFIGGLLINHQGGIKTIPVIVKVKDHWLLPLAVLFVGIVLGVGVSVYRSKGKPRDEVLVRVGQLRAQMKADEDLDKAKPFQSLIADCLIDMEMALQAERWDTGHSALGRAETIWGKWRKGRDNWLKQLTYSQELEQRLKELTPTTPYVKDAIRSLEDAIQNAPQLDGPNKLREQLDALAQQLNQYSQLQTKLKQLSQLRKYLPDTVRDLEQRRDSLRPSNLMDDANLQAKVEAANAEITKLEADVDAALAEATKLSAQQSQGEGVIEKSLSPVLGLTPLLSAPSIRPLTLDEQVTGAVARQRAFTWTSYAILVIVLAGAGFNQLYIDQPTFGANPWKDYTALLAWGFGAETARDAVTKVIEILQKSGTGMKV